MKPLTGILLAASVLFALACGCQKQDVETSPPQQLPEHVTYVDPELLTEVLCEHVSSERLTSGRLRITARFHNTLEKTAECQIKLRFRGDGGDVVDETNWTPLLLPRRETTQFRQTSLTTKARSYTALLRKARTK